MKGATLAYSNTNQVFSRFEEIQKHLHTYHLGLEPLCLKHLPVTLKSLLASDTLSVVEMDRLKKELCLSREMLVKQIKAAHREPNVEGGGALITKSLPSGMEYPVFFVIEKDVDYSQYDKFHINKSQQNVAVDEVLQMLCGKGYVLHARLPNHEVLTLTLDCLEEDTGWILTFSGHLEHIGSVSHALPGSKFLVQSIGPEQWKMHYAEGAGI